MSSRQGVVIRAVSGVYTVQSDSQIVHCSLRGNLKKDLQFSTSGSLPKRVTRARKQQVNDPLAVGDRVRYVDTVRGAGIIEEILPRQSRFSRAGFRGREQTLVSNLDQVFVVFACAEPRLDPWKLDRFLVAAEAAEIPPVIVANKDDLATEEEIGEAFGPFESIGYEIVRTSARTADGVDRLCDLLKDRISAFVGPSGVGKSSLINLIQPGSNLQIGEIGYVTYKGRHTTTGAQLIPLRIGGWVADTPGLRQFDLIEGDREEIANWFPEFRPHLDGCRFDDCRHESEPGCRLKQAVESGKVQQRRYESFQALAREADQRRKIQS